MNEERSPTEAPTKGDKPMLDDLIATLAEAAHCDTRTARLLAVELIFGKPTVED